MLNKYPLWKNLLILGVVLLGFLYSVPNLYQNDEAIQVTNTTVDINESDLAVVTTALEAAQVEFFGSEL
ncbi:MAG TPA: protein translocase subunit SecD, partial [Gammaproteobacteria bacterium]|nr:protein translocase subunit SecD [Gammaproteobacteria bacterium]